MSQPLEWVAADWGTTHLRVRLFGAGNAELAAFGSEDGMGRLQPADFEPALLKLIGDHLSDDRVTPVICCGMAGAKQGWIEAPYANTPCLPVGIASAVKPVLKDPRLAVYILPGVSQDTPADVMRGEETQIAGFVASNPGFDGTICLPGTHTKWARVRDGLIEAFTTYMTGELFALISEQSVLRHSVASDGFSDEAFKGGINDAFEKPEALAAMLFSLRAEGLLKGLAPEAAKARLSGLLIGLELAGASAMWSGKETVIIGSDALNALYQKALSTRGHTASVADVGLMTIAGLQAAYDELRDTKA